ncbi:alpha/beta hydrolase [Rhizohabitans arisaemae]|uniref:alpha/beta hydrolase n=1 Tax=Rhizohabitans arisaemae TaxID=2720610 RepID=UPI0024B230EC|nr:alpha/beta hydrolase [Rhizohabitans arisaemae]
MLDDRKPHAPAASRTPRPGGRLRRAVLTLIVLASVSVPVMGRAHTGAVAAPGPVAFLRLPAMTPEALAERYAAGRQAVEAAERMAVAHGHRSRAGALRALSDPARRLLYFDGRGGGRAVEVHGDLPSAERIAVLVPGSDTNLDKYGLLHGGALRLRRELGDTAAVIAWLYRTPATGSLAALTAGLADEAAPDLRAFIGDLAAARPTARVSLLCHSYGTVVCARAAPGLEVGDIVLYGSAGTGADDVAALRTRARVWAGRSGGDWIAHVPYTRLRLPFTTVGFGTDPVSPRFGARVFAAGDGGHSDYLRDGTSLRNIARIVSGRAPSEAGRGE